MMTKAMMTPPVAEAYQRIVRAASPRPTTWDAVIGNGRAVECLREALVASRIQDRPMPHTLIYGPPGTGKTTLARLIAAEQGGGFVETTASTLETFTDLIRILGRLNAERERTGKPSTLFVDEIHMLGQAKGRLSIDAEAIYPLLEDWALPHPLLGKTYRGADGVEYELISSTYLVWPFTMTAATTEPGMLSSPLLRRFLLSVELEPYTVEEIGQILLGAAARLGWPIEADAAAELATRSRLNPGCAYQRLTAARNRAVATGRDSISLAVAREVIDRLGLHPLGLTATDVRVLRLLVERAPRGVGAAELARSVGISASQFMGMTEPYLSLLGFIATFSRRVIRPAGARYLAELEEGRTAA